MPHYQLAWGDRWPALLQALGRKQKQVLFSPFTALPEGDGIPWLSSCLWMNEDRREWPQYRNQEGLLQYYVMDPASILAARALEVGASDSVLDMCAAPGGKTLVLAQALGEGGVLDANEFSSARRERLKKVIQQYVPRDQRRQIFVKGRDGLKYSLMAKNQYSRILVDAPCSGEKYLFSGNAPSLNTGGQSNKPYHTTDISRIRTLAKRQYALLASALVATKEGGRIVYSTCALSREENDGVVERLLSRKSDQVRWVEVKSLGAEGEKTDFGWHYLPDRCGFGPIYFSVLMKV